MDDKTPKGALDRACQAHDKCFAECRGQHPCGGINKQSCMEQCDNTLVFSSRSISSNDSDSSRIERWFLEKAIGWHLGVDSSPSASCTKE